MKHTALHEETRRGPARSTATEAPRSSKPTRLLHPFRLTTRAVGILMVAKLANTLCECHALREQSRMKYKRAPSAVAARLPCFECFQDLVVPEAKEKDSKQIAAPYAIEFNRPPQAPEGNLA